MDQDSKIWTFALLTLSCIFSVIAGVSLVIPTEIPTNKLEDEAKIMELAKSRSGDGGKYLGSHRADIISEFYTKKEHLGFGKTSVKVWFLTASFPAAIALLIVLFSTFPQLKMGAYFANKVKVENEKLKHYKKTLDELIRIQEKISK